MKIKSEQEQLIAAGIEISSLIVHQKFKFARAQRRMDRKENWLISFIFDSSSTLLYIRDKELSILNTLIEYREMITNQAKTAKQ